MKINNEIASKIGEYFKDKPVLKAYLFGSRARAEEDQKSDIDILIELDYSHPIGLEFVKMQLDLEEILNGKVDLVTEKSISKYIQSNIEKDKTLIYER